MALTSLMAGRLKPEKKPYSILDGKGLSLYVAPNGTKSWHFRFSWQYKQQRISLGTYPEINLREARKLRDDVKLLIGKGIDPRTYRNANSSRQGELFRSFVQQWLDFKLIRVSAKASLDKKNEGLSSTQIQIERYLRMDILPLLGDMPLKSITRADVNAVQKKIEERGALSIAEKVRTWLNEIFRYAVALGIIEINPAQYMEYVAIPYRNINHNPWLHMDELPELLLKLKNYQGMQQTQLGIKLLLLTGANIGHLRYAEPQHFDLEQNLWFVPLEYTRQRSSSINNRTSYPVILSQQAKSIIEQLLASMLPYQKYLLCHRLNAREATSENTIQKALKCLGFAGRLTGQGIKKTVFEGLTSLNYSKNWIDAQLLHFDNDVIRRTYNHAEYIKPRQKMMQDWADRLDQLEMSYQCSSQAQPRNNPD